MNIPDFSAFESFIYCLGYLRTQHELPPMVAAQLTPGSCLPWQRPLGTRQAAPWLAHCMHPQILEQAGQQADPGEPRALPEPPESSSQNRRPIPTAA